MNIDSAIIIAGGKGTRLAPAFPGIPKPMVQVSGRPVIEWIIKTNIKYGIRRYLVTVGYLGNQIREFLGDGSRFGIRIDYYEERNPLGTAGAFSLFSEWVTDKPFFVFYGDTVGDVDLQRMAHYHYRSRADATILVHPNDHPVDSDLACLDPNGRVNRIYSKPHPPELRARNLVNGALYLFNPSLISNIPRDSAVDFGKDLFPDWVRQFRLFGYRSTEYLKDMGTPYRRDRIENDLISGKIGRRNLRNKQRAIFLDRDGVINRNKSLIRRPDEIELIDGAADAIAKINRSDFLTIVVTNQSVVARGLTDEKGLDQIHGQLEWLLSSECGAYIDDIRYCPHHPDKGYPEEVKRYKIDCECRKPKPGMLLSAAEDYNIDLRRSALIGDSITDIEAGEQARVGQCIKIETDIDSSHSNSRHAVIHSSLFEAVDWLLEKSSLSQLE